MKLENKRMAQARRAEERKKQARNKLIQKYIWIPLTLIAIVAIVAVAKYTTPSSSTNETAAETAAAAETTQAAQEASATLNTDASLVVENGDTVNIDYIGYVDGVEFNGGNTKGNGADLEIGSHTYIDDFEDQIIGHKVGDIFDIQVTFPDSYGDTTTVNGDTVTLDNKEVTFAITLNGIYK